MHNKYTHMVVYHYGSMAMNIVVNEVLHFVKGWRDYGHLSEDLN